MLTAADYQALYQLINSGGGDTAKVSIIECEWLNATISGSKWRGIYLADRTNSTFNGVLLNDISIDSSGVPKHVNAVMQQPRKKGMSTVDSLLYAPLDPSCWGLSPYYDSKSGSYSGGYFYTKQTRTQVVNTGEYFTELVVPDSVKDAFESANISSGTSIKIAIQYL